MVVTKEQALAFIEALVGWEDLCENASRPKSPHARTHLEAVFGAGCVVSSFDFNNAFEFSKIDKTEKDLYLNDGIYNYERKSFEKLCRLVDYLEAVVNVLREAGINDAETTS